MSTHTATPPTPPAVQPGSEKLFVVCAKMGIAPHDGGGFLLESIGAVFLHRLIKLKLETSGVEILPSPYASMPSTGTLRQAIAAFKVRDVAAAARAVSPCLEGFAKQFVIGFADYREGIWRALWPEKPAFDLHSYLPELLESVPQQIKASEIIIQQYAEQLRTNGAGSGPNKPQGEPPPAPTA